MPYVSNTAVVTSPMSTGRWDEPDAEHPKPLEFGLYISDSSGDTTVNPFAPTSHAATRWIQI